MTFYAVYVREAHPEADGPLARFDAGMAGVPAPTTLAERAALADRLALDLPVLLDALDDATAAAYDALPDRLYLIDAQGRVAYRSPPGPEGFRPPDLAAAIEALLAEPRP